jgi:rRNA-processing protein FCF1
LRKVIFDSSFLMAVVERPTTWFEDIVDGVGKFQPVLLDCVRTELEGIASGEGKRSRNARVCLELASKFDAAACGGASVDDEIVSAARSTGALVASVDAELLAALKAAHLQAITLRSGRVSLD